MRTMLFSLTIVALTVIGLKAQDLNIHKTDGSIITIPLNTIDSITFIESGVSFECGTSTVTDAEGNIYNTVQIGDQCWMAQNLNTGTPINGDVSMTDNGIVEKYCYDNLEANCDIYGGLYQWKEMMQYTTPAGAQGICMEGWHLPSNVEFTTLFNYLGGTGVAGGNLKSTGTIETGTGLWYAPNTGATNNSGFTGLPGGFRDTDGSFFDMGYFGVWWSSSEDGNSHAWDLDLYNDSDDVAQETDIKSLGFSVRCLKD